MILHPKNNNFYNDCKYVFGEYIEVIDEPAPWNTNEAWTLDCIYIWQTSNT